LATILGNEFGVEIQVFMDCFVLVIFSEKHKKVIVKELVDFL
jgi:hypothetical protein